MQTMFRLLPNTLSLALVALFALFAIGCDQKSTSDAKTDDATTSAPSDDVDASPSAATAPEPAITTAEARQLLDTWLKAQNDGEFDAYSGLYAEKLEGIKRVGPRTYSFDRKGWLADRGRMFEKEMTVKAEDVDISTTGRTAVVRFTQTWKSGDFQDVGPKQLVLMESDDGAKIAREEMLRSNVVSSENPKSLYNPLDAAMVVEPDYIVVSTAADGLETTKLRTLDRSGVAIADLESVPDRFSELVGKSFVVERTEGSACESKIESLHVLARATPHFGQIDYWNGEYGEPRLSDEQVAREIWELSKGPGHLVVGKLESPCKGALWAHATDAKVDAIGSAPLTGELRDRAVAAFRQLPGHAEIQKSFRNWSESGVWSDDATNVTYFGAEDAIRYVAVWARAGDGCGEFIGEFWAIYEVGESGALKLLTDPKAPGELSLPKAAVEVGPNLIFVTDDVQIRKVGDVWRRTVDAEVPYFDCPC